MGALREFGRVVRIGTIGQYNTPDAPPPRLNYADIVEKSLRLEGFLVSNYRDLQEELNEFAVPHLQSGRLALDETVVDGFEHIVDAFLGMLSGRNTGKTIVRDRTEAPSRRSLTSPTESCRRVKGPSACTSCTDL